MRWEAWGSHLYMTSNTRFGTFDTERQAYECIDARLRESAHLKVWTHTWVKAVPSPSEVKE